MERDYREIERLHAADKMPDWVYYQVNGKSAEENWVLQHQALQRKAE